MDQQALVAHGFYAILVFLGGALWGSVVSARRPEHRLAVITRYFEALSIIWKHDRTGGLRPIRQAIGALAEVVSTLVQWSLHIPLDIAHRIAARLHRRALGVLPAWTADFTGVLPKHAGPVIQKGDSPAIRNLAEEAVETWGERRLSFSDRVAYYHELDVATGVFRRLEVTVPGQVPHRKDFGFTVTIPLTLEGSRRLQTGNSPFSTLSRTTGDIEVKPEAALALLIQGVAAIPRRRRELDQLWRLGLRTHHHASNEEPEARIRALMMDAVGSNLCQQIVDLCPDWASERPVILADTCEDFMAGLMKGWGFDQLPNAVDGTILWRLDLERSETLGGRRFTEQPLSNQAEAFIRHLWKNFPSAPPHLGGARTGLLPPSISQRPRPREPRT